tara:strand:- start:28769 stop:29041 length:273 start_codon:yes stop_codon:yes gene_type:complete
MTEKKNLTKKELVEKLKDICADEAAELFVSTGMDYTFDHYDSEVKALVVRELSTSSQPVTYDALAPLEKKIKEINNRLLVYILYEQEEEI